MGRRVEPIFEMGERMFIHLSSPPIDYVKSNIISEVLFRGNPKT